MLSYNKTKRERESISISTQLALQLAMYDHYKFCDLSLFSFNFNMEQVITSKNSKRNKKNPRGNNHFNIQSRIPLKIHKTRIKMNKSDNGHGKSRGRKSRVCTWEKITKIRTADGEHSDADRARSHR